MMGGVIALGNFDGMHRGHRFLIDAAVKKAEKMGVPAQVVTFEPHPRSVFQPNGAPFRLTAFVLKERLLKAAGIDEVISLPFTLEFARMPARAFVETILLRQTGAAHIVAGHDFTFGHDRAGDMRKLAEWLHPDHVGVTEIAPVRDEGGVLSSTRIREFLRQGDVTGARHILDRDWSISGAIVKGAQRGRSIGVPTANIMLGEYLRPRYGVYAIRAGRTGEALIHHGVANIGTRPTVDGKNEHLEAHLFDFDQDIYGQEWEFALTKFIRPERKFENFEALKAQIYCDIETAKRC